MMKVRDENSVFLLVDTPIYREQCLELWNQFNKNLTNDVFKHLEDITHDGYGSFVIKFEEGHDLTFNDTFAVTLWEAGGELIDDILFINEMVYDLVEEGDHTPAEIIQYYNNAIERIGYPLDKQATIDAFEYRGQEYIDAIESVFEEVA